jgi:hypothetical protein
LALDQFARQSEIAPSDRRPRGTSVSRRTDTNSTFARPEVPANRRSLAIDRVDGSSSRFTLAVTITALVKVKESCGNTATSKLRHTSGQLGTTRCGRSGVMTAAGVVPVLPLTHPVTMAAASAIGAAGQCRTRVRANNSASDFEDQL